MAVYTCHLSYVENIKRIVASASPGINTRSYVKTKAKWARGMAQLIE
jgi:hypothetical protein